MISNQSAELAILQQRVADLQQQLQHRNGRYSSQIEQAKQEWEVTVDALPQLVCLLDDQQRVTRVNRTLERWGLGSVKTVKGRTLPQLLHGSQATKPDSYLTNLLAEVWPNLHYHGAVDREVRDRFLKRYLRFQFRSLTENRLYCTGNFVAVIIEDVTTRKELEAQELQAREIRYRAVVEDQTELICRYKPNMTLTFVNGAFCRYWRTSEELLVGQSFLMFLPQPDNELFQIDFTNFTFNNPTQIIECQVKLPNGQLCWQRWTMRAIFDNKNQLVEFQAVGRDITERKVAEQALKDSEVRFRLAFEHGPLGMMIGAINQAKRPFLQVNQTLCKMLGYSQADFKSMQIPNDFTHPDDIELSHQLYEAVWNRKIEIGKLEKRYLTKNGQVMWGNVTFSVVRDEQNQPLYSMVIIEDITIRKQTEERLRIFEAAVEASVDGISISDAHQPDFPLIYVNTGFTQITGYTAQDVLGKNCRFLQGDGPKQSQALKLRHAIEIGQRERVILRNYRKNGTPFWNEVILYPLHNQKNQLTHIVGLQRDVTIQKQLQEGLQAICELGQRLTLLRNDHEIIKDVVITASDILNVDKIVCGQVDWRRQQLTYRHEVVEGQYIEQEVVSTLNSQSEIGTAVVQSGMAIHLPNLTQDLNHGSQICSKLAVPMRVNGQVIGVLMAVCNQRHIFKETDQTLLQTLADMAAVALENARLYKTERQQRRRIEQSQSHLIQSEKMAALGHLTASITHEINNPIQTMKMGLALIEDGLRESVIEQSEMLEYITMVQEEIERVGEILTNMRNFYQTEANDYATNRFYTTSSRHYQANLHAILENLLKLTQEKLRYNQVEVNYEWDDNLPLIDGNEGQLKQVLLNLILNAIDSMADHGGWLTVKTTQQFDTVEIQIADTGHGIPVELQSQIFQPLFTTKAKGSGLGLFVCHEIVEAHGGQIEMISNVEQGTIFTITLPIQHHIDQQPT